MDIHQTAEILREKTSKVKTIMILDTLEFMRKGGRCTAIQSFMGDILKIRPVIGVVDAKLTLMEKIRGKREKALAELMNKVIENKDNLDQKRLIITHALGLKDSLYVKEQFEKLLNINEIMITETGCSVSSHCGPNTLGILYMWK
jgi:DegV family protein with EDD domain